MTIALALRGVEWTKVGNGGSNSYLPQPERARQVPSLRLTETSGIVELKDENLRRGRAGKRSLDRFLPPADKLEGDEKEHGEKKS